MRKGVTHSTLFLALVIFAESTAFGIKDLVQIGRFMKHKSSLQMPLAAMDLEYNSKAFDAYLSQKALANEQMLRAFSPDGGPDQPEVQSFTPIGTSDMVDPFTGDFSYNIPLMDVDGYPINLAYQAGVTMDQEASWVGLGWNLNPGVINRAMRGLPDEYDGTDQVTKEMNQKNNVTTGLTIGGNYELFGFGIPDVAAQDGNTDEPNSFNLNLSYGASYNTYNGLTSTFSIGPSLAFSQYSGISKNYGLGFSGSTLGGASLSPTIGFSKKNGDVTNGLNIGSPWNSRGGLSNASITYSRTINKSKELRVSLKTIGYKKDATIALPISSSFNFGASSFTPSISMPMRTFGFTFRYKFGTDLAGNDLSIYVQGARTTQWLQEKSVTVPAYGYMHLQKASKNANVMMDFNRENDGPFTKNTPAVAIPNVTYDIFSVSGQGVAGSYRPVRSDLGFVFDGKTTMNSVDGSGGFEVNTGGTFRAGLDISVTVFRSKSGAWADNGNNVAQVLKYQELPIYFREANEKAVDADLTHFDKIGGADAVRFALKNNRRLDNILEKTEDNQLPVVNDYTRSGVDKRNQVMYPLTNAELKDLYGSDLNPNLFIASDEDNKYGHHIGMFTVQNTDGTRYEYGIAAYSHSQKSVSFAMGKTLNNNSATPQVDLHTGLVSYQPGSDNSLNNTKGVDNSYNAVTTPAFPHSYLLTSVLNSDYVDADNIKGPSKGDLGGYLKLNYTKTDSYKWRTPAVASQASFDEGLNTNVHDDKGHYVYGEKELWYVTSIVSKNHIAIFHSTEDRKDGTSVAGENGGLGTEKMRVLRKITLYSLPDYEEHGASAVPLKEVHFEYDYSLCKNYELNNSTDQASSGKLTLKKVYFTYQGSKKGKRSPYVFHYSNFNPDYNIKEQDRWNTYKPQPTVLTHNVSEGDLKPSDFPYTGFNKQAVDVYASAWNLKAIDLPSGGRIEVRYESDDYGYVQHKSAQEMLRIVGIEFEGATSGTVKINQNTSNPAIYVELLPDATSPSGYYEKSISHYVKIGQLMYFRALLRFMDGNNPRYDFVPGYGKVTSASFEDFDGRRVLKIQLAGAELKEDEPNYNPILVAGAQFARLHLSRFIPPATSSNSLDNSNGQDVIDGLVSSFASLKELFIEPNVSLKNQDIGNHIVLNKSWVRLQNPIKSKLGGGHRVKEIRIYDQWDAMTNSAMTGYYYGQQYSYTTKEGTSSGVAAYEPQMGGDENPFKQPVFYDTKVLLAADERNYQETPFGEQFFPTASVGYSRVTIKDIPRPGVKRTATGKVVHEFFTAKDFPTLVKRTDSKVKRLKLPSIGFFVSMMVDEMAVSQGFVVETNDMHGKPSRQLVYAEDQSEPISSVEYHYKKEALGNLYSPLGVDLSPDPAYHLTNYVKTINPDGTVSTRSIGMNYDAFTDFRENTSNTVSASGEINLNFTAPVFLWPTLTGSGSYERTAFRSASFVKVIERFGVQDSTVATDLSSRVTTSNLAYDAVTGTVLLTQTQTNFEDKVYSFTYPAHWYYSQMGQAYLNVGKIFANLTFSQGGTNQVSTASSVFKGDEVLLYFNNHNIQSAWITESNLTGIKAQFKNGEPVEGLVQRMKILRSGNRNQQTTPIGSITLRENPLNLLTGNVFEQVLQAGAVEYSDDWRTFCECFLDENAQNYTTNPYVLGIRGTWRPKASYVHLSGRTQSYNQGNSNIRQDGMFTSFTPFYKRQGGKWNIDRRDWTYTSSVTEFSPFGQALETVDALNRYSSSMFGYNQTLPIAVAANTRYRQIGFDGFEDYDFDNCSDNHFKLGEGATLVNTESHTGRYSLKVNAGQSLVYSTTFVEPGCEDVVCDISYTFNANTNQLIGSNGQAPYQYSYEVISGNANIEFNADGTGLIIQRITPKAKVRITITDALGCQKIIELNLGDA